MEALGELRGTITDNAGQPVSGVVIHVNKTGGDRFLEVTHEDGSFAFKRLPPGEYLLICDKEGYRHQETAVAIGAEEHAELALKLEEG